jgi:NAD(P)-dependent dehydrogenase (short-subunit alcohol dehydrogenase family)
MFGLTDVVAFANEHFDGDRTRAIVAMGRGEAPYDYKGKPHYALVKLVVAWWAAALARRLPPGMTVNAVSPGAALATAAVRHQSGAFKLMNSVMRVIAPVFGMAGSVAQAAGRYVEAYDYGPERNGHFYASRAGKLVGPVVEQKHDHIVDGDSQEAAWNAVVELSGGATVTMARRREVA